MIAMEEIFATYLKKDEQGNWQINERFFDQIIPKNEPITTGYGQCFECKTEEEYVLYRVRENWRKQNPNNQIPLWSKTRHKSSD